MAFIVLIAQLKVILKISGENSPPVSHKATPKGPDPKWCHYYPPPYPRGNSRSVVQHTGLHPVKAAVPTLMRWMLNLHKSSHTYLTHSSRTPSQASVSHAKSAWCSLQHPRNPEAEHNPEKCLYPHSHIQLQVMSFKWLMNGHYYKDVYKTSLLEDPE